MPFLCLFFYRVDRNLPVLLILLCTNCSPLNSADDNNLNYDAALNDDNDDDDAAAAAAAVADGDCDNPIVIDDSDDDDDSDTSNDAHVAPANVDDRKAPYVIITICCVCSYHKIVLTPHCFSTTTDYFYFTVRRLLFSVQEKWKSPLPLWVKAG